jgi:hypothetical protein
MSKKDRLKEEYIYDNRQDGFHEVNDKEGKAINRDLSKVIEGLFSNELSGTKYLRYNCQQLVELIESKIDFKSSESDRLLTEIKKRKTVPGILKEMAEVLF